MAPKYSICIPNFNSARFIAETIESALAQSLPPDQYEVVVSDNASSDQSLDVINGYLPRIRLVKRTATLPIIEHWNACLDEARGTYVILLHSDDLIDGNFLEICGGILDSRPDLKMVSCLARLIDADGSVIRLQKRTTRPVESTFDLLLRGNVVTPPSLLVRKVFYDCSGQYNSSIGYIADYELTVRGAEESGLMLFDMYLCSYRRHSSNGGAAHVAIMADIEHDIIARKLWTRKYGLDAAQCLQLNQRMVRGHLMMTICALELGHRRNALQRLRAIKASFPVQVSERTLFLCLWLLAGIPAAWRILALTTSVYRRRSHLPRQA